MGKQKTTSKKKPVQKIVPEEGTVAFALTKGLTPHPDLIDFWNKLVRETNRIEKKLGKKYTAQNKDYTEETKRISQRHIQVLGKRVSMNRKKTPEVLSDLKENFEWHMEEMKRIRWASNNVFDHLKQAFEAISNPAIDNEEKKEQAKARAKAKLEYAKAME